MPWPPDKICKHIAALWAGATGSGVSSSERSTALTRLNRLQAEHNLSDVELAYIAECFDHPQAKWEEPNPLDMILKLLELYHIVLPLPERIVVALWILHTWIYRQFLHTPHLLIHSADTGSGKTALMMLMDQLVHEPFYSADASTAAIRDQIYDFPESTIMQDEGEHLVALWNHDRSFKSLFDQSHHWRGVGHRVKCGKRTPFPCFCPWVIAMRANPHTLPRQMVSRSILIEMVKSSEGRDVIKPDEPNLILGRAIISKWAQTFRAPDEVKDLPPGREAGDNWRVLIAIADDLGYSATARAIMRMMVRPQDDQAIALLRDIRRIFVRDNLHCIFTRELLDALHKLEDGFWDEFPGINGNEKLHKVTRDELYRLLGFKRVYKTNVRKEGNKFGKGFYRHQFEAVWSELFGDTLTQASKVISLPRHNKRHGGGTEGDAEEDTKEDTEGAA
jgi:Protein of unknown function (DUF3631)